jgi:hypothetical protein
MLRGIAGTLSLWLAGALALRALVVPGETCPAVSNASAATAASEAALWMDRALQDDGTYLYEYDADKDRNTPEYNVVRHAGVTMALYILAASGDRSGVATADRALAWMRDNLYSSGDWAAFQSPYDQSIELGATALMLAGIEQRRLATGDAQYDVLMHRLARFLVAMQQDDGSMLSEWQIARGAPYAGIRSKYGTGEAFWALTVMHRLFPGEGWEGKARLTADYLSLHRDTVERQKYPPWADQWAAYGLAEMADWPLTDDNVRYARALADRFGFLMRVEAQRTDGWLSELVHGRKARAAGMGTWVEGLGSLWRLASADPRMADMREKIGERAVCGAGMLASRQVSPSQAPQFVRPDIARGAWFTKGVTRMDDQQHALSALVRIQAVIDARNREAGR